MKIDSYVKKDEKSNENTKFEIKLGEKQTKLEFVEKIVFLLFENFLVFFLNIFIEKLRHFCIRICIL